MLRMKASSVQNMQGKLSADPFHGKKQARKLKRSPWFAPVMRAEGHQFARDADGIACITIPRTRKKRRRMKSLTEDSCGRRKEVA